MPCRTPPTHTHTHTIPRVPGIFPELSTMPGTGWRSKLQLLKSTNSGLKENKKRSPLLQSQNNVICLTVLNFIRKGRRYQFYAGADSGKHKSPWREILHYTARTLHLSPSRLRPRPGCGDHHWEHLRGGLREGRKSSTRPAPCVSLFTPSHGVFWVVTYPRPRRTYWKTIPEPRTLEITQIKARSTTRTRSATRSNFRLRRVPRILCVSHQTSPTKEPR